VGNKSTAVMLVVC